MERLVGLGRAIKRGLTGISKVVLGCIVFVAIIAAWPYVEVAMYAGGLLWLVGGLLLIPFFLISGLLKGQPTKSQPIAETYAPVVPKTDPVSRPLPEGFFERRRHVRAEAAAKHAELLKLFEAFLRETEPLVPKGSKYEKVALYRHAWKRAAILAIIYQRKGDQALTTQFQELEKLAAERYFQVAPSGLYGKAPLQFGEKTGARLLKLEQQRLEWKERQQA